MENKSLIYKKLLKDNVSSVNKLLNIILWCFFAILIIYYFIASTDILRVSEQFVLKWSGFVLLLNVINIILGKMNISHNIKKYYSIFAIEAALIFGAFDVRIGYHIVYVLVPVISCIYFDKKLTFSISLISLIAMNMCIVYVSTDRVTNLYKNYTRMRYIKATCIGYSVEFVAMMCVLWMLTTRIVQVMSNLAEKNKNILDMQQNIISSFAGLIESRDDDTGHHVKRTEKFVEVILDALDELKIYEKEMKRIRPDMISRAAQLHDIGKLKITDTILNKPGKLTDEEYETIKIHTSEGKEMIEKYLEGVEDQEFITEAKNIALSHHERWDGKGYPHGLQKEEIPFSARIMAVADVFDALVNKRCYKDAIGLEEAFVIVEQGAGTQFDPDIVRAFMHKKETIIELYNKKIKDV